ncbi:MAG: WYL domain-containing protein [Chitinophagaceae bacterium]|nr:MAG: WYL domain-containing protein [Chitinophagaceae bacterium]
MPLNKSFQRRIEVLDACLRRRQRVWTMNALHEEVNDQVEGLGGERISKRTLYDDLNHIIYELDAPVEKYKVGKQTCYRYSNPDYSIKNLPLQQEEVGYLRDALDVLRQINGFQLAHELESVISKLENTLANSTERRQSIIQFEYSALTSGTNWLDDIFQAIREYTALNVIYQPFNKEASEFVFHAYLLKEYRNRWFVLGRHEGFEGLTTLALDRIQKLKASSRTYIANDVLDPDTYFDFVVGVTLPPDAQPETVSLSIDQSLAPYIITKPIHNSQKLVGTESNGDIILELFVVDNFELRSTILGHGPRIRVLKPYTLQQAIKALYQDGVAVYEQLQSNHVPKEPKLA